MRDHLDVRELAHSTIPVVAAILMLATAPLWEGRVEVPASASFWPLLALVAIAAVAALYAPAGRRTLGLGAAALPPAIWYFGVAWGGWLAAGAFVLRELLARLFFGLPLRRLQAIRLLPTATDAARLGLATAAAGGLWVAGVGEGPGQLSRQGFTLWGMAAVALYLAVVLLLHLVESRWLDPGRRWLSKEVGRSLPLDLGGWLIGGLLTPVVMALGWSSALFLLLAVALLASEAARNLQLRRRAVARVSELWEATRAGHRIIFRDPDLATMAAHVLEECRNVMSFHWSQFELLQGGGEVNSWYAGPDGHIEEGIPSPAESPPALPGIHRRSTWKILGRELKGEGEVIARLRFWCDPRRLESTSIELLDSLLPQIAASVHRALLERRARQDPLTGLADRRVLESRLERAFAETHEEGGSMAVVMCDLDRFKRINDTHGHDVGDRALLRVVQILEEHRRDTDLCSRYGGEEFALVLEKTDGGTAMQIAERLRIEVERCVFVEGDTRIPLRLSAGVASYPELQVRQGRDLLVLADEALREAKKKGRNRSLLHLGRNRFRTATGSTLEEETAATEPEAPTLFA